MLLDPVLGRANEESTLPQPHSKTPATILIIIISLPHSITILLWELTTMLPATSSPMNCDAMLAYSRQLLGDFGVLGPK